MGRIEITTEPHELIIDGKLICLMQADPSADPKWDTLLETPYAVGNRGRVELIEALSALAETPKDAEKLLKADPGGRTINVLTERYIQEVTGFPLGRPEPSTEGLKKTGDT